MDTVTRSKKRNRRNSSNTRFTADANGWETSIKPFESANGNHPLSVHGKWHGPRKLVGSDQVSEVFVDRDVEEWAEDDASSGPGALIQSLVAGPLRGTPEAPITGWEPPPLEDVVTQLRAAGHDPAVDDQANIRLSLKSRGCDGQVVILRADTQLRLTMQLGRWDALNKLRETAMLQLARQFNDQTRLVRIAWHTDDTCRRCEAQVDLSGLPVEPSHQGLWQGMLQVATLGLEMALCQLTRELDVLAQPRHEHLARRLTAGAPDNNNKPRKPR